MKKLLLVLAVAGFVACNSNKSENKTESTATQQTTTTDTSSKAKTDTGSKMSADTTKK